MIKVTVFGVSDCHEISVDYDGYNYLLVFGKDINGGFFAIINHGVSGGLSSSFGDTFYNSEIIGHALNNYETGKALASVIKEVTEL